MPAVIAPPQQPEPVAVAPVSPPEPKYASHVASYRTLAEAETAWASFIQRYPIVKDETRRYVEVDLGGQRGKVVRLLIGNFNEQGQAQSYCRRLRDAGLYCAVHDLPQAAPAKTAS